MSAQVLCLTEVNAAGILTTLSKIKTYNGRVRLFENNRTQPPQNSSGCRGRGHGHCRDSDHGHVRVFRVGDPSDGHGQRGHGLRSNSQRNIDRPRSAGQPTLRLHTEAGSNSLHATCSGRLPDTNTRLPSCNHIPETQAVRELPWGAAALQS